MANARITEVDAVRGFALVGILLANIGFFSDPLALARMSTSPGPGTFLIDLVATTKFYVLFSFLFGYSFTLQMASAERAGVGVVGRTLRRCLGLLVVGVLHAILLWPGDILTLYAFLGVLLVLCRGISHRAAVRTAVVLVSLLGFVFLALTVLTLVFGGSTEEAPAPGAAEGFFGGFGDLVRLHLDLQPGTSIMIYLIQGPMAFAMFLLGMLAGRARLFERLGEYRNLFGRVRVIGLTVGGLGAVAYAVTDWAWRGTAWALLGLGIGDVTAPLLTAAYVVTLIEVMWRWPAVTRVLSSAGRMAATGYVTQSLVLVLIFTGTGLGLAGKVPSLVVPVIALAVYALQLAVFSLWQRRFRRGPVEWFLHTITVGPARSVPVRG